MLSAATAMTTYHSVVIPYTPNNPTQWHPMIKTAVVTRGAFETSGEAQLWATNNIPEHAYSLTTRDGKMVPRNTEELVEITRRDDIFKALASAVETRRTSSGQSVIVLVRDKDLHAAARRALFAVAKEGHPSYPLNPQFGTDFWGTSPGAGVSPAPWRIHLTNDHGPHECCLRPGSVDHKGDFCFHEGCACPC